MAKSTKRVMLKILDTAPPEQPSLFPAYGAVVICIIINYLKRKSGLAVTGQDWTVGDSSFVIVFGTDCILSHLA